MKNDERNRKEDMYNNIMTPRKNTKSQCVIFLILLASIPHIFHNTLSQTSLASGLIFISIIYSTALFRINHLKIKIKTRYINAILFLFTYATVIQNTNATITLKIAGSIIGIVLMWITSLIIAQHLKNTSDVNLTASLHLTCLTLIPLGLAYTILKLNIPGYDNPKAIFPFTELSHFSIFIGPILLCIIALSNKTIVRIITMLSILTLGYFLKNITLIIYFLLAIPLITRFKPINIILVFCSALVTAYLLLSNPYFKDRLVLTDASDNLSVLIYLQGIQDAANCLKESNFLGIGFQQMGRQKASNITDKIDRVLNNKDFTINREDGSFLAAKLIAEFGILGIVMIIFYIYYFFKSFRIISSKLDPIPKVELAAHTYIYAFSVEVFVRGIGYFSPEIILYTASFIYLYAFSDLPNVRPRHYN